MAEKKKEIDSGESLTDLEMLEKVCNDLYEEFQKDKTKTKVSDLMKVIELKKKLAVTGKSEKKFWNMVNDARQEELGGKRKQKPKTTAKKAHRKK